MKKMNLEDMFKGWFIGDFAQSILQTKSFEVACKYYKAGAYEAKHMHKEADEITVLVYGVVEMNGTRYTSGDIVLVAKGEATDFKVIEDCATIVVKAPSVVGDKYPV